MTTHNLLSLHSLHVPEYHLSVDEFLSGANEFLFKVISLAENILLSPSFSSELYKNLGYLKNQVKKIELFNPDLSNNTTELSLNIKELKKRIKKIYEFSSSILIKSTEDDQNLKNFTNELVNIIIDSDSNVDDLKLSVIMKIFHSHNKSTEGSLLNKTAEIFEVYKEYLSISDKYSQLRQLYNSNSLKDPSNRDDLDFIISEIIYTQKNIHKLIDSIDIITHYVANENPFLTVHEAIQLLPLNPMVIDNDDSCLSLLSELYNLYESGILAGSSKQLVIEYLMNLLDPAGSNRMSILLNLHEVEKNATSFAKRLIHVSRSLQFFGFEGASSDIRNRVIIQPHIISAKHSQTFELLHKRVCVKEEIAYLSQSLKIEVFHHLMEICNPQTMNDANLLIGKLDKLQLSYQHFTECLRSGIEQIQITKHQKIVIENYLKICTSLLTQGELLLSFFLYENILLNTQQSCHEAWDSILNKCRRHFDFAQNLFNKEKKTRNFFLKIRELDNICIPDISQIKSDIIELNNKIKSEIDALQLNLIKIFPDIEIYILKFLEDLLNTDFTKRIQLIDIYNQIYDQTIEFAYSTNSNESIPKLSEAENVIFSTLNTHLLLADEGKFILENFKEQLLTLQFYYKNTTKNEDSKNYYNKYIKMHYFD